MLVYDPLPQEEGDGGNEKAPTELQLGGGLREVPETQTNSRSVAREKQADEAAPGRENSQLNLDSANQFIDLIAPDGACVWQTFGEGSQKTAMYLTTRFAGPFAKRLGKLRELNDAGACVAVTINRSRGAGRKAENISAVRAVFVDLDGAPLEPVLQAGVEPHAIVESSPGRWHVYWLVDDLPLSAFTPFQKALASKFGGDVSVSDLPRVMRVPGFVHRKEVPFTSRLKQLDAELPRYRWEDLRSRLRLELSDQDGGVRASPAARAAPDRRETEDTQPISSCPSSVLLLSTGARVTVPSACWPREVGHRNYSLFQFARLLAKHAKDASADEREAHCRWWWKECMTRGVIGTEPFSATHLDFENQWPKVRYPSTGDGSGPHWARIVSASHSVPVPDALGGHPVSEMDARLYQLLKAALNHQRDVHGNDVIFLSCRQVGTALDLSHETAARMLKWFARKGVLELVGEHVPGSRKAQRYRLLIE